MTPIMRQIIMSKKTTKYYTGGVEDVAWVEGYQVGDTKSQSKESDHLLLNAERVTTTTQIAYVIDNSIDLSKIKKIYVEWKNTGTNSASNTTALVVSTTKNGTITVYNSTFNRSRNFAKTIDVLDVTSLTGSYYLRVHSAAYANSIVSNLLVYRIWGVG